MDKKNFYGAVSITARLSFNIEAEIKEEAIEKIDELVKKDDVVLVKASRGMELEKIVEYLNK